MRPIILSALVALCLSGCSSPVIKYIAICAVDPKAQCN